MQPNRARNLDAVKIASSDIKNDAYKSSSLVKLVSSSRYIGMMHNPLLPVCSIVQSPIPYSEVSAEASYAFDGIKPTSTFTKVQSKFEIIDKTKAIARKVAAAHFLYLNRKVIEFESMYVHLISSSEYAKNRHDEERYEFDFSRLNKFYLQSVELLSLCLGLTPRVMSFLIF